MYRETTKQKIKQHIIQNSPISSNRLQYLGGVKKRVHNKTLLKIIEDLQCEDFIIVDEHKMTNRTYRVITHKSLIVI